MLQRKPGCICPAFVVEGCPNPEHRALMGQGAVPVRALRRRHQLIVRLRIALAVLRGLVR